MQPDRRTRQPILPLVVYSLLSGIFVVGTVMLGGELLLDGWPGELVAAVRLVAALVLATVAAAVADPVLDRYGTWLGWSCGHCWLCRRRERRGGPMRADPQPPTLAVACYCLLAGAANFAAVTGAGWLLDGYGSGVTLGAQAGLVLTLTWVAGSAGEPILAWLLPRGGRDAA